jgi:hypothetical protein
LTPSTTNLTKTWFDELCGESDVRRDNGDDSSHHEPTNYHFVSHQIHVYLDTMISVRLTARLSAFHNFKARSRTSSFHKAAFASSASSSESSPTCDVVQGPSLLRTPVARPSPSLLFVPGLRSLPFWTSPDYSRIAYGDPVVSHVVNHLEKHSDTIRNEYLSQQQQDNKLPPTNDYHDHEKSLHKGKWEWFTYLNKGNVQGNFVSCFYFLMLL